jgi:hypothetical protein
MATKNSKSTKRIEVTDTGSKFIVKELKMNDSDTQYAGGEPRFMEQPEAQVRQKQLIQSLNWYSRFCGSKHAKEFIVEYLDLADRQELSKKLARVSESEIITTYGWLARLALRGLELSDAEQDRLNQEITRLLATVNKPEVVAVVEDKPQNRTNVQEVMRERASEAAGELEGLLDEFIECDNKLDINGRVMSELTGRNILPQHISMLVEIWQKKIKEFTEVLESDDRQLREAYGHYNKTQIKNIIKFCEAIIADLNGYVSVKRAAKAPRAKKAVPVEKIVKNLKYLKKFEDATNKLKLESTSPTKLHGASECWIYNTANRKLIHYVADDYAKTFTVKGNSLLGFDKAKSECKTLRKPTMLTEFMKSGKPAKRTQFKDLTTTPTEPNGRFNENMIILQAW